MDALKGLSLKYKNVDCREMGARLLQELKNSLSAIDISLITSITAAKEYINLLYKFRTAIAENDKSHGENYPQLINSLLSVGEDGLYSNNLRFLFELIQNVDDCEFPNPEDCKLEIQFVFNKGKMILRYNEVGFSPFNVFAITGIAEAAKNISSEKIEIGEKGIGFKSVFGVSKKVLIQSGFFSFSLDRDNFTIPIAEYDNYQPVSGTQITLFTDDKTVEDIYRQIADQYCNKKALLNKNPLLFLNKLTHLRFFSDSFRDLNFYVSRISLDTSKNDISVETNVKLKVHLKDHHDGFDKSVENEITCTRYTLPIVYDELACQSRYGKNTRIAGKTGKKMYLSLVAPTVEDLSCVDKGTLYSFLPTQISLNIPFAIHAPFKLDASREFVHPQENNKWFIDTCNKLHELVSFAYQDLAHKIKQDIVCYLPENGKSIFEVSNEKINCLAIRPEFKSKTFLSLPLFYTEDGQYCAANEVTCINESEVVDPHVAYSLLSCQKSLFIPPKNYAVGKFSIEIQRNINKRIFETAIQNPKLTEDCLKYLSTQPKDSITSKEFEHLENIYLIPDQIIEFSKDKHFYQLFKSYSSELIKIKKRPAYLIDSKDIVTISDCMYEGFSIEDVPELIRFYLNLINLGCVVLNDMPSSSFFVTKNALVLSKQNTLKAFASFCAYIDNNDLFSAQLLIRNASQQLNELDDNSDLPIEKYMKNLRHVRESVRAAFGKIAYSNYITLILNSGSDPKRFINELLQNADDCIYADDEIPTFSFNIEKDILKTVSNEVGFTRTNVRAITSIESTKKELLDSSNNTIGKKGVGFKTVFAIASNVEIASGEFHFSLSDDAPTVPELLNSKTTTPGTIMKFKLKSPLDNSSFDESDILTLCLCLRKLKRLTIGKYEVSIEDIPNRRNIYINGTKYEFLKTDYAFTTDEQKDLDIKQHIFCYAATDFSEKKVIDNRLYCGLPTDIKINVPVSIDAPLDLTTSRDLPLKNEHNESIKKHSYKALVQLLVENRSILRSHVLDLLKFKETIISVVHDYVPSLFSDDEWNQYNFICLLRDLEFLPTMNKDVFISPAMHGKRYPFVMEILLKNNEDIGLEPEQILDVGYGDKYAPQLNALSCKQETLTNLLLILKNYTDKYIGDENFRTRLYSLLNNSTISESDKKLLRTMPIIPVYGISSFQTLYVKWEPDKIFIKENTNRSTERYYVLNEKILSKNDCESYLGVNINQMNQDYERIKYISALENAIQKNASINPSALYTHILNEYNLGHITQFGAECVLLKAKEDGILPMKNSYGEITTSSLFICQKTKGFWENSFIENIVLSKECESLAKLLKYSDLSEIYYNDIPFKYKRNLSNEDIEYLAEPYFIHSAEILGHFIEDTLIDEEQIKEYDLQFLMGQEQADTYNYDFPTEHVNNLSKIHNLICERCKNPSIIQKVSEQHIVHKVMYNGQLSNINSTELRVRIMNRYKADNDIYFCQICKRQKHSRHIEVNNIENDPKFYWPEMRVCLCLECSKWFEECRSNTYYYNQFFENLEDADVSGNTPIEVSIGNRTITFTQTHLAEIKEILEQENAL